MSSVLYNPMNGRLTAGRSACVALRQHGTDTTFSYEVAKPQEGSNHWSCTENNRNNARNVNFNNGNTNGNNKYNSNVVRPVAALSGYNVPPCFTDSVWAAYHDCLRGKKRSEGAMEYMQTAASDIPHLAAELWTGTYQPGTSTCFLVRYPKWREVFAAGFRDRIVHHWICLRLEPLFEHRFRSQGDVSFNCRKGFGTDAAVRHVSEAMRLVSDNYHKEAWVFKGDLVGFFMSIDKTLLWYLLERFMRRWQFREQHFGWSHYGLAGLPVMYWDILLRTTKTVVMHHPERDCILNSPVHLWKQFVSPTKSLFTSPTGEPIGNLTTQLFANFLMSFFVAHAQFLFRRERFGMAQFVDDFLLVCGNQQAIIRNIPRIEAFLRKLHLTLHKDKRYLQPVSHGVLFVGSFVKPGRTYLSNRTVARLKEHCEGFGRLLSEKSATPCDLSHIEQALNSYLGFTRNRHAYRFRRMCIESMGADLWKYFYMKGHYESIRLKRKCQPINV